MFRVDLLEASLIDQGRGLPRLGVAVVMILRLVHDGALLGDCMFVKAGALADHPIKYGHS